MSTLTTEHIPAPPTEADYREAFAWATAGGVRVMRYIDEILDAYNADHAHGRP